MILLGNTKAKNLTLLTVYTVHQSLFLYRILILNPMPTLSALKAFLDRSGRKPAIEGRKQEVDQPLRASSILTNISRYFLFSTFSNITKV